jgi:hypothetical protein
MTAGNIYVCNEGDWLYGNNIASYKSVKMFYFYNSPCHNYDWTFDLNSLEKYGIENEKNCTH